MKTLVADDNGTNRLILKEALSAWGAKVSTVSNGLETLVELQLAKVSGDPYKLLLLDGRMPDMDGFQVLEKFGETFGLTGMTVLILTSDNRSSDIARTYKLGLGGYLVKPIRRSDLLKAITIAIGRTKNASAEDAVADESLAEMEPVKILLVEDSADNQLLVQSYLKKSRCEVTVAENGKVAIDRYPRERFDIVFMDLQMPIMDGYTATKWIRTWEQENRRRPTPIIALTAYAMNEDVARALEAGCTAHITKPIKKATFLDAIAKHITKVMR
jgi:CheY-like chemotaxis protein